MAACYLVGSLSIVTSTHAFESHIDWTFKTFETSNSEWWQSLDVQTVPGVNYRLQESSSLNPEDWTTLSSSYGTGANWICPVFPGIEPSSPDLPQGPVLPPSNAPSVRMAYLTIERSDTGGTLVSWSSLDTNTPIRKLLSNVVLDPVWDEFESFYLHPHGSYFFALSPRLGTPVTFVDPGTGLGTLDAAMIEDFVTALPAITSNIENSVFAAASFSPTPIQSGERAFFRISADWTVDSDSDGRFDWQEITIDGNNPFATDSDGDGVSDVDEVIQGTNPNSPSNYTLAWRRIERSLTYDFSLGSGSQANTGTLALNASWDATLNQSEALTSPIAFTALEGRLASIPFHASIPSGAFTGLIPAEGNAAIPIENISIRSATMKHQRVWLTRKPAKDYPFESLAVLFTDRTLNGGKLDPVFELKKFTLAANQEASNPIDLEDGFTSDGPASGNIPPPEGTPPPIAVPEDHSESFTKQLVPIQVDDDEFATGVDNTSVNAATSDIGRLDKFWIMAPAGETPAGLPCENAMKFNLPFVPGVQMEIVPPAAPPPPAVPPPSATPNPAILSLSASSSCIWRGVGSESKDLAIVWKLGLAGPPVGPKQDVDLPIGVKMMKRRTVKVAVHPIASIIPGVNNQPPTHNSPDLLPTESQIEEELNKVFGRQVNAYFDVKILDEEKIPFDVAGENSFPGLTFKSGTSVPVPGDGILCFTDWNSGEPALMTANRPTGYDIHVYVFGGATPIVFYQKTPEDPFQFEAKEQAVGRANGILGANYCIVDGDRDARNRDLDGNPTDYQMTPDVRSIPGVLHTIAHEIGHIMLPNIGHPDDEEGIAPLKGTDRTKRLMCSGPRCSITQSKLLVKTEWDMAEEWLKNRPLGDN